jgi:hypothetical protein
MRRSVGTGTNQGIELIGFRALRHSLHGLLNCQLVWKEICTRLGVTSKSRDTNRRRLGCSVQCSQHCKIQSVLFLQQREDEVGSATMLFDSNELATVYDFLSDGVRTLLHVPDPTLRRQSPSRYHVNSRENQTWGRMPTRRRMSSGSFLTPFSLSITIGH